MIRVWLSWFIFVLANLIIRVLFVVGFVILGIREGFDRAFTNKMGHNVR